MPPAYMFVREYLVQTWEIADARLKVGDACFDGRYGFFGSLDTLSEEIEVVCHRYCVLRRYCFNRFFESTLTPAIYQLQDVGTRDIVDRCSTHNTFGLLCCSLR